MGGGCQADCNSNNHPPEPSLWNSTIGRRAFMKKTGMATAATVIALHGFRAEVLASESAACNLVQTLVRGEFFMYNAGGPITITAVGTGANASIAHEAAMADLHNKIAASGRLNTAATPNPSLTMANICSSSPLTGISTSKFPDYSDPTIENSIPINDELTGPGYQETITFKIPSGYNSIITTYTYGQCPH